MNGHMHNVKLLLANGADPTLADQDDKRPSLWAAEKGYEAIANLCKLKEREYRTEADEGMDIS